MSKRQYFGTDIDTVHRQATARYPGFRVVIWNPNRCDIHDVVLGSPASPAYDVSAYVLQVDFVENIVWENNDDAMASSLRIDVAYDPDADPVEMTERVWLDGTPIRVYQGDVRVPIDDWVPIFTGVVRGVPTTQEHTRDGQIRVLRIIAVDRAEKYLNKVVTARAYDVGEDVGKSAVETAIEWMSLDRREILIGRQDYEIGHKQSQLVDIEVLKGIAQILFTTGKKPRFDADGFLVAADTDLDKPAVREYSSKDFAVSMVREQQLTSGYNSIRLLGLDNELTEVVEQEKRLAHGSITAGFFEDGVRDEISFSEQDGKEGGGRRAKNTRLGKWKVSTVGKLVGEDLSWTPVLEEDGYTTFSGFISFSTGYGPEIQLALTIEWISAMTSAHIFRTVADTSVAPGDAGTAALVFELAADAILLAQLLLMSEIGRVYWEVHGQPFANVYQQIAATATVDGLLTEDVKELTLRNDWLYDIDYMRTRARELLRRELVKGWAYTIEMLDDPLIETDDVIEIDGLRYYVASIRKRLSRPAPGTMKLYAWRLA